MANYANLIAAIRAAVKQNGTNDITGQVMQDVLVAMTNTIGRYAAFAGTAMPSTNPNSPDQTVYYLTSIPGTYANFGGIVVPPDRLVALHNIEGAWQMLVVATFGDGSLVPIDPALDPDSVNPVENRVLYGVIDALTTRVTALESAIGSPIVKHYLYNSALKDITGATYAGKEILNFQAMIAGVDVSVITFASQVGNIISIHGFEVSGGSWNTVSYQADANTTLEQAVGVNQSFVGDGFIVYR